MRLLNTTTLELVEMLPPLPPYAILSHRWSADEVSYEEYCLVRDDGQYSALQRQERPWLEERAEKAIKIRARSGYRKIVDLCIFAELHCQRWVWIDSCWYAAKTGCKDNLRLVNG